MTIQFGINAWLESGDALEFRPAVPEPGSTYLLTFDVSIIPYGSIGSGVATWFSQPLDFLAYESSEDGKQRILTIELVATDSAEILGERTATIVIASSRWREAASLPMAAEVDDAWMASFDPDFEHQTDAFKLLRENPQHPLVVARFQFRVRINDTADSMEVGVRLFEGEPPASMPLDETPLLYYPESRELLLPWGSAAPPPMAVSPMLESAPPGEDQERTVTVFYGTDRKNTGSSEPYETYSGDRGDFELGLLKVSIPRGHEVGEIERPRFGWRWLESVDKHVVLLSVTTLAEATFFAQFNEEVATTPRKEAFVFIHGYNVNFENAALRAGQMAYDLQRLGLDAVPVLYSWPSAGSTAAYVADLDNSDWSVPHLADFLDDLRAKSGVEVVHLIAHSMGNRVLTRALRRLADKGSSARFNEIVLAAPDIDVEIFRQIAGEIQAFGRRMSLYANSNDKALNTSEALRLGRHRAGDVDNGKIAIFDGVESIDASDLDTGFMGHSYFADEQHVLLDISRVMAHSAAPDERTWLSRRSDGAGVWWAFGS